MKRQKYIPVICCLIMAALLCTNASAQIKGYVVNYQLENGDTLYLIKLPPIVVYPLPKANSKAWKDYRKLVYNFKKVYPYALMAKTRMDEMETKLSQIPNAKDRQQLIDQYEKELFRDFEQPIKKLSFSQGKLLLKLVDRELGQTSYYLIKDLKGNFKAFFWQGVAKFFGADLKKPYDKYGEDREVERLVKMYQCGSFEALCYQMGV